MCCRKKIIPRNWRLNNWEGLGSTLRKVELFFTCLFIWKSYRGTDRQIYQLLHFPNGLSSMGCAKRKPGAWNSVSVSHMGGRVLNTAAIFHCFPSWISRVLNWKWSSQDWEPCPFGMSWCQPQRRWNSWLHILQVCCIAEVLPCIL